MSTNVYNAYRLESGVNLLELFPKIQVPASKVTVKAVAV